MKCEYPGCDREDAVERDRLTLCRPHRTAVARVRRPPPGSRNPPIRANLLLREKSEKLRDKLRRTKRSDEAIRAQAAIGVVAERVASNMVPGVVPPGFVDMAAMVLGDVLGQLLRVPASVDEVVTASTFERQVGTPNLAASAEPPSPFRIPRSPR